MTYFSRADIIYQGILLVISQFAVIALASGFILLFKRRSRSLKLAGIASIALLNIVLNILMQLDSNISEPDQNPILHIPCFVLLLIILLTIGLGFWIVMGETMRRKTINHTSIKEAFDTLPTGVCFFNEAGLPVLCNHAMHRFSFAVCGKDVQFITDLEACLKDDFQPSANTKKDGSVFILPDGRSRYLKNITVTDKEGNLYVQFIAVDVTQLHEKRGELQRQNAQLHHVQAELKRLSANMVNITREEEILNTKMRVHDEMGRCLMAAQKYLKEGSEENIPDSVVTAWQRAVSTIKYNNETREEDMLLQIKKTCDFIKLSYIQRGELPEDEDLAYLLTCALRECVTNAVHYAQATELYADFSETETEVSVVIYNSGKAPEQPIKEGGGLSTLRRRIEREGGSMVIQSLPEFRLTVTLPKGKKDIL